MNLSQPAGYNHLSISVSGRLIRYKGIRTYRWVTQHMDCTPSKAVGHTVQTQRGTRLALWVKSMRLKRWADRSADLAIWAHSKNSLGPCNPVSYWQKPAYQWQPNCDQTPAPGQRAPRACRAGPQISSLPRVKGQKKTWPAFRAPGSQPLTVAPFPQHTTWLPLFQYLPPPLGYWPIVFLSLPTTTRLESSCKGLIPVALRISEPT